MDQLNKTDRELLESVLQKPLHELTENDIAILNARRGYLNYAQRQAYKGIIINDIDREEEVDPKTAIPQQPTRYEDPTGENLTPSQPTTNQQPTEQAPVQPAQDVNPYDVKDPSELA